MSNYIKILSYMSGLHYALVSHLIKVDHRCTDILFDTIIKIHSFRQVGTSCELSVEVRKEFEGLVAYKFFNVCI